MVGGGGVRDWPRGGSPWKQGVGKRRGKFETDNDGGLDKICNLVCVSNAYWTLYVWPEKSIKSGLTHSP